MNTTGTDSSGTISLLRKNKKTSDFNPERSYHPLKKIRKKASGMMKTLRPQIKTRARKEEIRMERRRERNRGRITTMEKRIMMGRKMETEKERTPTPEAKTPTITIEEEEADTEITGTAAKTGEEEGISDLTDTRNGTTATNLEGLDMGGHMGTPGIVILFGTKG